MSVESDTCRCGHGLDAHEHFRRGTDCTLCGPQDCARYRPAGGRPSMLTRLTARLRHARRSASVQIHPSARPLGHDGRRPADPDGGDHAREA